MNLDYSFDSNTLREVRDFFGLFPNLIPMVPLVEELWFRSPSPCCHRLFSGHRWSQGLDD